MTAGFLGGNFLRGLAFRVLLFLSLALLPIGLIAVVQTREIDRQSNNRAELSLVAVTEQAASLERTMLQAAFGAAQALSAVIRLNLDDPQQCSANLAEYQKASPEFSMVGFVRTDGRMNCASVPKSFDFSASETFRTIVNNPRLTLLRIEAGAASDVPVVVVYTPVYSTDFETDKTLEGFVTLSIPERKFIEADGPERQFLPLHVVTLNGKGDVITAEKGVAAAKAELPADIALHTLSSRNGVVFEAANTAGEIRYYAVTEIVPGIAFSMSIWPLDTPIMKTGVSGKLSAFLPVLMWLASLVVAFWALNRLAITHIRKLGRQMRRFALNRTLPNKPLGGGVPTEIVDMEAAFIGMADSILRDEAALEDSLRQKNILLKEVHHRVKNNLQLISSIMNMQIRQSRTADAKEVLQRLQDRILGLATVHKQLYQDNDLNRVAGGTLLHEIVNQVLAVGLPKDSNIDIQQNYDNVLLEPDDAAPLTLLTSEAVTNALKYLSAAEGTAPYLTVSLVQNGADRAVLCIANSITKNVTGDGTGLGSRLISAFARQLNGTVTIKDDNGEYRLTLDFPVPQHMKPTYDY